MPHGLLSLFNMNSLNIITARVSPPPSPTHSRSNSVSAGLDDDKALDVPDDKADGHEAQPSAAAAAEGSSDEKRYHDDNDRDDDAEAAFATEKTPLFCESKPDGKRSRWWHVMPRGIASSFISSIRWLLAMLSAPGYYLLACFYDDFGKFAPMTQLKKLFGFHGGDLGTDKLYGSAERPNKTGRNPRHLGVPSKAFHSSSTSSSGVSSESEDEPHAAKSRHTRSRSAQPSDETGAARRSIRIKLNDEEQRKHRKSQSTASHGKGDLNRSDLSAQLKSPTSPIAALTKYPKTPAPPRPLIPRRQPSYLNLLEPTRKQQKTLILDLDETLIHSMSKGGRMNSGHMIEVQLNAASLGMSGQSSAAQHPILYWVNKRPYCDEFLRRVCKWFNLVIFTASVQEYADPVIDWLETERKFFSARYYRQHCTYRQGAYIKDLSAVEPDLSKVMILDNSPLSYLFHEDNAIPIQGWINDPTDGDLMHLVPLLEGLQYVHDVRALLGLRSGEYGHLQA
ncbi:NLI interacting factor-like phosphatase domain-containing protein [Trichoderma longibrachiatum]